ncbi:MAG: VacJ family lipoprotein, partial [Nitrospinae bacterium]|nr:VacJ family lipoprotein [Nitrospinota bacterium]
YIESRETQLALRVFKEVNNTSLHIGEYENLKRDALDLYPFLRDVYEQNRAKKIRE